MATKYTPGLRIPDMPVVPAGEYTLYGSAGGHANASIAWDPATNSTIGSVAATYHDFSDDGENVLTGDDGFHFEVDALYNFFTANGILVTKVDGFKPWVQPCNNC